MSRYFNIAGPNRERDNFGLDPLKRVDCEAIESLIDQGRYIMVCSARQSGKTTFLLALQKRINSDGKYRCFYCNIEAAQPAVNDLGSGIRLILSRLAAQAQIDFEDTWPYENFVSIFEHVGPDGALTAFFEQWRMRGNSSLPLVLLLDGIDLLEGKTLVSVLRQLRTGQINGPKHFLQSVLYSGVRDIRDADIDVGENKSLLGRCGSDIREKAVILYNFTQNEIKELCDQYTAETGQAFQENAYVRLYALTGGRPWLVNAILCEAIYEMGFGRDVARTITYGMIEAAKDHFIARQDAYMDQLSAKLGNSSVRTTLFPILSGGAWKRRPPQGDLDYLEDLELIRRSPTGWGIPSAIYREIIPMVLGRPLKEELSHLVDRSQFIKPDGRLDFRAIIELYQKLYCENFLTWGRRYDLEGVLAQMLLFAFLHYILGDRGRMECDYALGTGRVDISVGWGYSLASGERREERCIIELRLYDSTKSHETMILQGLAQTTAYAQPRRAQDIFMIVLDEDDSKTWYDRLFREEHVHNGVAVHVYGL
ncbi:MAG: AAA-like domain-containing protein [Synergistaceae bacterium]|jgi:hypothetical protein|nr:AAA-like domain-containing protein [Synergistaceae bacterium]